ncbi:radical SAM protein [Streptosporangium sp. NPDC002721]|uniref:radical SAM protein n=1 Tax=Streptosporangium sp. NPDC002721 TaxID=3366188 RepID=UPI0036A2C619
MDILALRPVPAAAVLMAITRRCPLRCRHCSTGSLPASEEHPGEIFQRFAGTFAPGDGPRLVMLTGGEPLLRPRLARSLAEAAARGGGRTMILSGMFFAPRLPPAAGEKVRIPPAIAGAIDAADHFSASLDAFHEEEVPRESVFAVMRALLARGKDLSFHVTGTGPGDPYLRDVTSAVRREFGDRVPMLVSRVKPVGRARATAPPPTRTATATTTAEAVTALKTGTATATATRTAGAALTPGTGPPPGTGTATATATATGDATTTTTGDATATAGATAVAGSALPCAMAAWPAVGFDGTITACCNQDVVDHRPVPGHLRLGHAGTDDWDTVRERCLESGVLRALRTYGPLWLAGAPPSRGYCETCRTLDVPPPARTPAAAFVERRVLDLQLAGGGTAFARRYGCPPYDDLVSLGHPEREHDL